MIWLVTAQPDEIGLQSKKHLKICTEKIEWRTWLKIHRLVLTVEHKFMVLREFSRTTPQIHNHDMYDKWKETKLKVRMIERCCKMVEAIVYNSRNRNANQRPSEKTTGEGETQLSSHAPPRFEQLKRRGKFKQKLKAWRKQALYNSMIETWKPPSSPLDKDNGNSLRAMKATSPLQAPLKPPLNPLQGEALQAPFKPPSTQKASSPLQAPWSLPKVKPPWSPLQAPFKPPWSPSSPLHLHKASSPLQAPLKPPSSPPSSPLKLSEGEAPFKPPWSPLEAPFKPPSSPSKPPSPLERFKPPSSPLEGPLKPRSSPLQAPPCEGEAPLKPCEGEALFKPSWRIPSKGASLKVKPPSSLKGASWRSPEPSSLKVPPPFGSSCLGSRFR